MGFWTYKTSLHFHTGFGRRRVRLDNEIAHHRNQSDANHGLGELLAGTDSRTEAEGHHVRCATGTSGFETPGIV